MERLQLETALEREAHKLVTQIREHMYDHTMLYLQRNHPDVDREVADRILQIAKNAVDDGLFSKIDFFNQGIDKALTEFTETESSEGTTALKAGKLPKTPKKSNEEKS